jgi:hypothetical protein
MQYLLFLYHRVAAPDDAGERACAAATPAQVGHVVGCAILGESTSLVMRDWHLTVDLDHESIGQPDEMLVIEARDLNDAIRIADALPRADLERVEIRATVGGWTTAAAD